MTNEKNFLRVISRFSKRSLTWLLVFGSLLITGCVNYDIGVTFDNPNHGEFVQHIQLGERLTSFSGDSVQEWLNSIERRTRKLEGKSQRISNQEVIVTIPFNNGKELETKFNEFFNPNGQNPDKTAIPKIASQMKLAQNNFLLLVRNRLSYDLDLRSLSLVANNGKVLVNNPSSILDLKFGLNTPWGARSVKTDTSLEPEIKKGHQLLWQLKPGEINHVEAVFWLPSPIGWGTLLIVLFIAGGMYLRYNFMPDPKIQFANTPPIPHSPT